jgi:hypothetical protein
MLQAWVYAAHSRRVLHFCAADEFLVGTAAGSAKPNGMRQETNGAEQNPRQEQTFEHAVTPRKRRLFE